MDNDDIKQTQLHAIKNGYYENLTDDGYCYHAEDGNTYGDYDEYAWKDNIDNAR